MPLKSQSRHRGDIFDVSPTKRRKRAVNAVCGDAPNTLSTARYASVNTRINPSHTGETSTRDVFALSSTLETSPRDGLTLSSVLYTLYIYPHPIKNEFLPETRKAADRLKILFDTYGNVAKKPVNEESSAIYNILQDLKGKYAADIDTVGAGQWVTELETRNAAVERLVKERFDETASRCDIVLKTARTELDAAYAAIRKRVNALVEVEGAGAYEQFIKALNAVIAKYAVKRAHGHNHGHQKGGEVTDGGEMT
jgi:hypothetical protein